MDVSTLAKEIMSGDRKSLARGITLVESQRPDHRKQALELLDSIHSSTGNSIRIGITGIPGVGKSTFIEALGKTIIGAGHKLAVLAIDPSSSQNSGSILGDKTRMEWLSRHENAFIRPSPSGGTLGGVAARTRESMLLCEAAGFDVVIVETVGVGQSETEVMNITDSFLMLAMPGTGDELQGIKRGIMETADIIVINKADGHNKEAAQRAKKQIEIALHLFPAHPSGWSPKVRLASAMESTGIDSCWKLLMERQSQISDSGWLEHLRGKQRDLAFQRALEVSIYEQVIRRLESAKDLSDVRDQVQSGKLNEHSAVLRVMELIGGLLS